MPLFEWKAEFEIGEAGIDSQHREWFKRIQALFTALEGGVAAAETLGVMEFAADYTTRHFALEELMLRMARYPDLVEHIASHRALAGRVAALLDAARKGDPAAPLQAAQLLSKWVGNHIKTADMAYVPWMKRVLGNLPPMPATEG